MGEWEYMGMVYLTFARANLSCSCMAFPVARIKERVPMAADHLAEVKELFRLYDSDADNSLSLNELFLLLQDVGNHITSLPATAQVAAQQGKYLGKKLHKTARAAPGQHVTVTDEQVSSPFKYFHLGTLAYIGNAAVFDFGKQSFMGGLVAMYAWRSIYWNEQVSSRTRALLMIDWIIRCEKVIPRLFHYQFNICRGIWGRDLSRL